MIQPRYRDEEPFGLSNGTLPTPGRCRRASRTPSRRLGHSVRVRPRANGPEASARCRRPLLRRRRGTRPVTQVLCPGSRSSPDTRGACGTVPASGRLVAVAALDRLRRRTIDRRTYRHLRMIGRQLTSTSCPPGFHDLEHRFASFPGVTTCLASATDRSTAKAERFAENGQVDLQAIVPFQRPGSAETQARSAVAAHRLDVADQRAAMADRVAIGHFFVLVRLDEQPRPRPAEDRLQVRFVMARVPRYSAAIEQFAVIVGRGGDVERTFFAALDLEASHARRASAGK